MRTKRIGLAAIILALVGPGYSPPLQPQTAFTILRPPPFPPPPLFPPPPPQEGQK